MQAANDRDLPGHDRRLDLVPDYGAPMRILVETDIEDHADLAKTGTRRVTKVHQGQQRQDGVR